MTASLLVAALSIIPQPREAVELGGFVPFTTFYYAEADVKEILAYAAERHITVVPEIALRQSLLAYLSH